MQRGTRFVLVAEFLDLRLNSFEVAFGIFKTHFQLRNECLQFLTFLSNNIKITLGGLERISKTYVSLHIREDEAMTSSRLLVFDRGLKSELPVGNLLLQLIVGVDEQFVFIEGRLDVRNIDPKLLELFAIILNLLIPVRKLNLFECKLLMNALFRLEPEGGELDGMHQTYSSRRVDTIFACSSSFVVRSLTAAA